jgi:Chitobiase/beta-hexosaminidase C-terminal domain/Fibronectin type III domain
MTPATFATSRGDTMSRTASVGTPPDQSTTLTARRGWPRAVLVGVLAASLSGAALLTASSASAAVPTFPDNLLVFPNRDFVTVEGYQDHIGETATVEITRPGVGVVGSAEGVVAEGDVAFEINHPGGYCWGAGTGLKVTPDILPGDVASIRFGGTKAGDTRVQDGFVTADAALSTTNLTNDTVTVVGRIGPDVIKDNTEQRIVEPALTGTAVARRDVRAIPGPLTPAPKGGYSSSLEFNDANHTFTATYIFDDPSVAKIAANASLGERLLSWELTDAAANRQGVTIAEFGEPGGPGLGGCPNGPLQSGPPGPSDVSAAKVSGGVKLTWTPAVAIPGTPAITGYRATAVAATVTGGEQIEIGRRISGQAATGTTITGLASGETYDVEVVSVSSVGTTFPAVHATPVTDTVAPTVASSPTGGSFAVPQKVTLTANEPGSQIFFTTNGTDPVQGDVLAPSAQLFTAPITISTNTTLKFVAFDPTGNVSAIGEQSFVITNTPTPDAPAFGTPVIGNGQITLTFTSNDPSVTGYGIQAYDRDGGFVSGLRETSTSPFTVTGLTEGTQYLFTVKAKNVNGYGPESAKLGPLTPQGTVVANAGPDQTGVARNTNVSLAGAGSSTGGTYQWTQLATGTGNPITATDPDKVTLSGASTLSPSFLLPFYKYPMTAKPLTFQLAVTVAGTTRTDAVLVIPSSDVVAIGTAKWKTGDFRVTGTSSTVGGIVTVRSAPDGNGNVKIYGQAAVTAAAPPAVGGVWDLRVRAGAGLPTSNPGPVFADSNRGGTAGPFTVSG